MEIKRYREVPKLSIKRLRRIAVSQVQAFVVKCSKCGSKGLSKKRVTDFLCQKCKQTEKEAGKA